MGKNLFILAILTMSLMACSTKEDVADEILTKIISLRQ